MFEVIIRKTENVIIKIRMFNNKIFPGAFAPFNEDNFSKLLCVIVH